MRLLYLCQRVPYPPDRGDRIPVFHHLRRLSRNHDVVVGSLSSLGAAESEKLEDELGVKVIAPLHSAIRKIGGMTEALLKRKPLSLGHFWNPELQKRLSEESAKATFDAIIVFSSSMAQYVERLTAVPRIMHFCDVDSQKWASMAARTHGLKRWIYGRESRVLLEYERKIARQFEISCVVSENEAELFRNHIPGVAVHIIENGVDVDYFSDIPRHSNGLNIVFVGVMDYEPNVEAVLFFAKHVWHRIRTVHDDARFIVVGSRPTSKVRKLTTIPGIEVTGYVPDIRSYLSSATLSIAPLAIARGVQNKILESMAAGVPVLTTPAVAKGLPRGAELGIFVAEREPEEFGNRLVDLLKSPGILEKSGAAAKEFVRQKCTWDEKLRSLDELLERATGERRKAAR